MEIRPVPFLSQPRRVVCLDCGWSDTARNKDYAKWIAGRHVCSPEVMEGGSDGSS